MVGLLVVFAALNSVLSLAYYAPLVNAVYRKQPSRRQCSTPAPIPLQMITPAGRCWPGRGRAWPVAEPGRVADRPGRRGAAGRLWAALSHDEVSAMNELILTPPIAFLIFVVLAGILVTEIGRALAGPKTPI